jgi:hypothetical protein
MTEFVRHHPGDLAVGPGGFELPDAGTSAARQRERVDLFQVHDVERVPEGRLPKLVGDFLDESIADSVDEVARWTVIHHRQLLRTSAAARRPSSTSCSGE